jgi:anti-anti-sigma regulatory factor
MKGNGHIGWRNERRGRLVHLVTALTGERSDWGELDACVAEAMAAGGRFVVVDLSRLEEVPPEVLGALVRAHRRLGWRNGALAVVAPQEESAMRSIETLDGSLNLYESVEEVVHAG